MDIVSPDLTIRNEGRIKYYKLGVKHYAPIVSVMGQPHPLRKNFRTATAAEIYGEQVVRRYRALLMAGKHD